jgi:hypothetical protein
MWGLRCFTTNPSGYLVEPQNQDRRLGGRRRDSGVPRSSDVEGHAARSWGLRGEDADCGEVMPPDENVHYLTILPLRGVYLLLSSRGSLVICSTQRDYSITLGLDSNSSIRTAS